MKKRNYTVLFAALFALAFFVACGGSGTSTKGSDDKGSKGSKDSKDDIQVVLPASYTANDGRLLGAQCAQCHGTNGISVNRWDSIAGEDNLHNEMLEYGDSHIMTAQARGYTQEEIGMIENWLQTLTKY